MQKSRKKNLLTLLILGVIILASISLVACNKTPEVEVFTVMLTSGDGYQVTSEQIVNVERGQSAHFDINFEEGYALYSATIGKLENNVLTIENVQYSSTVVFDARKMAKNVTILGEKAKIESAGGGNIFFDGVKTKINITADENYNVESLYVNSRKVELLTQENRYATAEITVENNMIIEANVLGDEYEFEVMIDDNRGEYEIVSSTVKDDIYRYGDTITIATKPNSYQYKFGYYEYNGEKIFDKQELTVEIKSKTVINIQYYGENDNKVFYNPNGGEIVEDALIPIFLATETYLNLDHCYNKIKRDGYSLIGLQEGKDGVIHALGGMVKMPNKELEIFAVWKKWTDSDNFLFSMNSDGKYLVDGLSKKGIDAKLTEIVIPEVYDGKAVVGVSANAFKNNDNLVSVYFSKNIKIVQEKAFYGCKNLKNIMIFETMTDKADNAFDNCPKFTTFEVNATSDPDNHDSYNSSYGQRYCQLADKERGPMLIILSGSSGAYGVDAETILNSTDLEPIVFGLQNAMSLLPLLSLIYNNVREGDIVILAPEFLYWMYAAYELNYYGNFQYMQKNYDCIKNINLTDSPDNFFLNYCTSTFVDKRPGGTDTTNSILNKYGCLSNFREERTDGWFDTTWLLDVATYFITDRLYLIVNKYALFMQNLGAKVYFSFPPYNGNALAAGKEESERAFFQKTLVDGFKKENIVQVISNVEDYKFPGKLFYNSNYHLSTTGTKVRTEQLVKDIKAQLAKEGINN